MNARRLFYAIPISTLFVLAVFASVARASTTISTDISTGGMLSVTGTSTLMGNVGVDTTTPASPLDVEGAGSLVSIGGTGIDPSVLTIVNTSAVNPLEIHSANARGIDVYTHSNTGFRAPAINLYRSLGTESSPLAVQSGDVLGYLTIGGGYNGSAYVGSAQIQVAANENWTGSANGSTVTFYTTSAGNNALSRSMTINNQNVGINDSSPAARLSVVGNAQIGFSSGQTAPANGLVVSGITGIGTSTPIANFQVANGSNATTTMEIGSSGQNKGSCLKLYRTDGSAIYAYVAAGATTFTLSTTACASVSNF
jgi:hypothetical protein